LGARRFSSPALSRLASYSWPGNVRELASVVYRAAVAADDQVVELAVVERSLPKPVGPRRLRGSDAQRLVSLYGGNVSAAAKAAGVPRSTFRFWLERRHGVPLSGGRYLLDGDSAEAPEEPNGSAVRAARRPTAEDACVAMGLCPESG
jgi:transcriptional regulator with GAF, ATPase, and Fis domain